ncbi:TPA: WbqC family protein [Morganella morganii]
MDKAKELIITIHQPESYPWCGFFNKMMNCDKYVILNSVDFRKNYYQNRNRILTKNNSIFLTIPVNKSSNKKINEIEISNDLWKQKHWTTILQTYNKSPFFYEIKNGLEILINNSGTNLSEFNISIILYFKKLLSIDCDIILSSELNLVTSSSELILDICKTVGASTYISGRDGREYLSEKDFIDNNINIIYQDYNIEPYTQFNNKNEFVPYMSIIDLISNIGIEKSKEYIRKGWSL